MRTASKIAQQSISLGLVAAMVLPPSAVALADESNRVALVPMVPIFGNLPDAVPQSTADKITELLAQELRQQDGVTLVPLPGAPKPAAAPSPAAPEPPPARAPLKHNAPAQPSGSTSDDDEGGGDSAGDTVAPFQGAGERPFTKGMAAIAKGKKDMQRLKFDAAVADLQEGIAGIEGSIDLLTDYAPLVDAYLQLAIAELRLDQRDAGQQALSAVVRLAPERGLQGSYPAVFTRMFNQLKQQLTQGPKGTVAVASTPAGQLVRIDGRDAGVTPVSLDLIPGPHFVVISGEGGKVTYEVNAQAGASVTVGSGEPPAHRPVGKLVATVEPQPESRSAPPPAKLDPLARLIAEITANNIDDHGGQALSALAAGAGNAFLLFGGVHFLDEERATIVLDTLLFSPSTNEVAALTQVQFDADLSAAPAEILKVATEVSQHFIKWEDALGLPQPVAPGFKPPKVTVRMAQAAGAREARKPAQEDGLPTAHTRRVEAHTDGQEGPDLGPNSELATQKSSDQSSFPWLPVGIGVGAAAVVAVGVVVAVILVNRKAGANPQVTW